MKPGSKFSLLCPPLLCLVTHSFTHSLQECQHLPLVLARQCSTKSSQKCTSMEEFPFHHFFSHNYWFFSRDAFQVRVLMSSEHSPLRLNPQKHPTVQLLEILTRLLICSMNPTAHQQALHVTHLGCSNPSKPIQKAVLPSYQALYLLFQILLPTFNYIK